MDVLEFYTSQSEFTDPGGYSKEYEALPENADEVVGLVRGMMLDFMDRWKHPIQNERWLETNIRYVDEMLEAIWSINKKAPAILMMHEDDAKMMASPSHFASLTVSMLRYLGYPARKRVGFVPSGEFFKEYAIEDCFMSYEIVEFYDKKDGAWKTLDPAGRGEGFICASLMYADVRDGKMDPSKLFNDEDNGMNVAIAMLIQDLCALNKNEIISWDRFGLMKKPLSDYSDDDWSRLDKLAQLINDNDKDIDALAKVYADNKDFRVSRVIFCNSPLVPPHEMVTRVVE